MTDKLQVAFLKARWHAAIVDQSLKGFAEELARAGVAVHITTYDVPGAFEMPLLAQKLAQTGRFQAIVAAALVVDGGIYRHDFVAQAVVSGLMDVQLKTGVPVFSLSLTPHQFQPTAEHINFYGAHFVQKGAEAAQAVLGIVAIDVNAPPAEPAPVALEAKKKK